MNLKSRNVMLFNGAAALLIGASLMYVVKSLAFSEGTPPCSERFEKGVQMALETGGRPVATADLQARAAGTDWSLLERTQVVKVAAGPSTYALQFDLAAPAAANQSREGAGFVWAPRAMKSAKSACLAYSVFLPENFKFGGGGQLPGLIGLMAPANRDEAAQEAGGAPANGQQADQDGDVVFSAAPVWNKEAIGQFAVRGPEIFVLQKGGYSKFEFPRGKWVRLEQEVMLDGTNLGNGSMRLWLDGELKLYAVLAKSNKVAGMTGVLSEVTVAGQRVDAKARDQKISISPFVVYWR